MTHPISLALLTLTLAPAAPQADGWERVERRLGAMGTSLRLVVEAPDRPQALASSELAAQAVERAEARLSTWREGSELARLNRSPVGRSVELSPELARELAEARAIWQLTAGAFDPSVGGWVEAWGLRTGGRRPSAEEIDSARVPGGLAALTLEGERATRTSERLTLEEGGFGKGAGLDAAARALAGSRTRGWLDLGGQVLLFGAHDGPQAFGVADPLDRAREVVSVSIDAGSLATSGNSERGIVVAGERLGHLLDPRLGRPAPDFGSVTVHAAGGLRADALATGLFVLGAEAALELASREPGVAVLVLEPLPDGALRLRSAGTWAHAPEILDPRVRVEPYVPAARGDELPPTAGTPTTRESQR